MKRPFLIPALVVISFVCMAWGTTGHFAVGHIAERHLTPRAANAVHDLLGADRLADVSTWADDIRGDEAYAGTDKWHYVNLPGGITDYATFATRVATQKQDNVYTAVKRCRATLESATAGRKEKVEALRFLVHFVGDLHQPMHVSHAEDHGGNRIQLKYRNVSTNLHTVWDSKLLDDRGWGYEKLAAHCDTASPQQLARWQQDSVMQWLWESYQVAEQLYAGAAQPGGRVLKRPYYRAHIATAHLRLQMAGARLAGMLNEIFDSGYRFPPAATSAVADTPLAVDINDVRSHMGAYATVCARIYGHKALDDIKLVNLGGAYPNAPMTVVLKGRAIKALKRLDGRKVCVTGKIISYKGTPEIVVTDPQMIQLAKDK